MVDESNPMRLARKAWNHLGLFTRQEAVEVSLRRASYAFGLDATLYLWIASGY